MPSSNYRTLIQFRNPNSSSWTTLSAIGNSFTLSPNLESSTATITLKKKHEDITRLIKNYAEVKIFSLLGKPSGYTVSSSDCKFYGFVTMPQVGINTGQGDYGTITALHKKFAFNDQTFYAKWNCEIVVGGGSYYFLNTRGLGSAITEVVNTVKVKEGTIYQTPTIGSIASTGITLYNTEVTDEPCGDAITNLLETAGNYYWDYKPISNTFYVKQFGSSGVAELKQQKYGSTDYDLLSFEYIPDCSDVVNNYVGITQISDGMQLVEEYSVGTASETPDGTAGAAWDSFKEADLLNGTIHLAGNGGYCPYHGIKEAGVVSDGYRDVYRLYQATGNGSWLSAELLPDKSYIIDYNNAKVDQNSFTGTMGSVPISPEVFIDKTYGTKIMIRFPERMLVQGTYDTTSQGWFLGSPSYEMDWKVTLSVKNLLGKYTNKRANFTVGNTASGAITLGSGTFGEIISTTSAYVASDSPFNRYRTVYFDNIHTPEQMEMAVNQLRNKLAVTGNIKNASRLRCVVNSAVMALDFTKKVNISYSDGDEYKNKNGFPMDIKSITYTDMPNDISISLELGKVIPQIPLPINKPMITKV